eukprot:c29677_g1_i1 orf=1-195(-)
MRLKECPSLWVKELVELKHQLRKLQEVKEKGLVVRARIKWDWNGAISGKVLFKALRTRENLRLIH